MISYYPIPDVFKVGSGFKTLENYDLDKLERFILTYTWSPNIWEGGKRTNLCFLHTDYCVLDIDDGLSLMEACDMFSGHWHIIATTENHQKPKKGKIADRFRVVLKFERRIDKLRDLTESMKRHNAKFKADTAIKDGARLFKKSREIISRNYDSTVTMKVFEGKETDTTRYKFDYEKNKKNPSLALMRMPKRVSDFINYGKCLPGKERNESIFICAMTLFRLASSFTETFNALDQAPFDRYDFTQDEIKRTVESAYKIHLDNISKITGPKSAVEKTGP